MHYTDMADELFSVRGKSREEEGMRAVTVRRGEVSITRILVKKDGLCRPKGRYVLLDVPELSLLDEREEAVIEQTAAELGELLPKSGTVLVLGVGNRRVTADALGARTVQRLFVTGEKPRKLGETELRPVVAVASGVEAETGLSLRRMAQAWIGAVNPSVLLCVDSLCSGEVGRLGRTIQISDTGLYPSQTDSDRSLTEETMGVPVVALGIPTLTESPEGEEWVTTPRRLDSVISHGSALLATAINCALQPDLSIAQLCWLSG